MAATTVITDELRAKVHDCARRQMTKTKAAEVCRVHRDTVRKLWPQSPLDPPPEIHCPSLPEPAPEAGGPCLPEPAELKYEPYAVDTQGAVGVLCDIHIPYHDKSVIQKCLDECRRRSAKAIFLNGDVLDCYQVSDFVRERSKPRMVEEIEKGRQLLAYIRAMFPHARIIYKEGNHDERLKRYIASRAPDLDDIPDIYLPSLLRAEQFGVEWVADKRIVMVGKLPVIHGHEYQGAGGVMPARWLYLRTGDTALTGHFHQPSNYTFRTIKDREVGMWSVGCACHLKPAYRPLNQWSHGYAMVEVSQGGAYAVENRRILKDGSVG